MLLSLALSFPARAADLDFTAPNNGQPYSFSVQLQVSEAEPYAGIQFKMELSSSASLSHAFAMGPVAEGARATEYKAASGTESFAFGYWCGSNAFSGDIPVGTLNFTYTGNDPQAVLITEMKIVRINEDGKSSVGVKKTPPVELITVSRDGSGILHTVTFDPDGGTRTGGGALVQHIPSGGAAIAPELARPGYTLAGWDKEFSNVASDLSVKALWQEDAGTPTQPPPGGGGPPATDGPGEDIEDLITPPLAGRLPFLDVNEDHWFYDDVVYVYENGLMNGVSDTRFGHETSITRGMIVTILGRRDGVHEDEYPSCAFADVADSAYYAPFIEWARQNDIVRGVSADRFEPNRAVSRQEIAAILYRYAGFAGYELPNSRPYEDFTDEAGIASYAIGPVRALYSAGVINGKPGGRFDPRGVATRAEAAAMIHRFLEALIPPE